MTYLHTQERTFSPPLRQSSISTCLRCKRCFLFRYRWGLCPILPQASSAAPNRGCIIHTVLAYEDSPEGNAALDAYHSAIASRIEAAISETKDPLGELTYALRDFEQTFSKALMLRRVLTRSCPQPDYVKTLCVEEPVTFQVTHPTAAKHGFPAMTLSSRLDKLVLDQRPESNHSVWVRDYKTTLRDADFFLTGYSYSLQCLLYRMAAEAWLSANTAEPHTVRGFILDILQVPTIRMSAADRDYTVATKTLKSGPNKGKEVTEKVYTGEPLFENYLKRCEEWYADKGKDAVRSYPIFYTGPTMTPDLLSVLYMAHRYTHLEKPTTRAYPKDLTASYCTYYERVCNYYPLCSSDEAAWSSIIEAKYTVKDPSESAADDVLESEPQPPTQE